MHPFDFHWKMVDTMARFRGYTEQLIHPLCRKYGITPQQMRILVALHYEGPSSLNSLAERSCMAGANLSTACKKLDGMGYLTRRRDEADERLLHISLTGEGEELVEELYRVCCEEYGKLSETISSDEAETITAGMSCLLGILQNQKDTHSQGDAL